MILDLDGQRLCCEIWPANATDVKSLLRIGERLRTRFHIQQVCVADRGMISPSVIEELETRDDRNYILGVQMRAVKVMRTVLATDEEPYEEACVSPHGRQGASGAAEDSRGDT